MGIQVTEMRALRRGKSTFYQILHYVAYVNNWRVYALQTVSNNHFDRIFSLSLIAIITFSLAINSSLRLFWFLLNLKMHLHANNCSTPIMVINACFYLRCNMSGMHLLDLLMMLLLVCTAAIELILYNCRGFLKINK